MLKTDRIIKIVKDYMESHNMVRRGQGVVIGLSGGPDSVFLTHVLYKLRETLGIKLSAVHVNHMYRGEESLRDALFSRELCGKYNIPYLEKERDVSEYARKNRLSFEEGGRKIRLEVYREALEYFGAEKAATGHNADDQAETLLMRIIRGTGKAGLAGIYPIYEKFLIRPMLSLAREEILEYLEVSRLDFRTDETNNDTVFFRNKIRIELLPLLKREYNPGIVKALCRNGETAREEMEFLRDYCSYHLDSAISGDGESSRLDMNKLTALPSYVVKFILREYVRRFRGNLDNMTYLHTGNLFELMEKPSGSSIELPGGIIAKKEYGNLILRRKAQGEKEALCSCELEFPGVYMLEDRGISISGEIIDPEGIRELGYRFSAYFDADELGEGDFTLRQRRPGDRFHPLGCSGGKKLKDFLIDEKIPWEMRDKIPILLHNGVIIWVAGVRQSELFRITPLTKRVLAVKIEKNGAL